MIIIVDEQQQPVFGLTDGFSLCQGLITETDRPFLTEYKKMPDRIQYE